MKTKIIIHSVVLLIGVGCFGVGLGSICSYLSGNPNFSVWYGGVPMAFSTSTVIMFIGLALYLIGKTHLIYDRYDKSQG